jgi:hypothetical protein
MQHAGEPTQAKANQDDAEATTGYRQGTRKECSRKRRMACHIGARRVAHDFWHCLGELQQRFKG